MKKLWQIVCAILLLFGGVGLANCTSPTATREAPSAQSLATGTVEIAEPKNTVTATAKVITSPTIQATPTIADSLLPTSSSTNVPTPAPTTTVAVTPVSCGDPPAVEISALELSNLSWEVTEFDDETVRQLLVPTFLPFPIDVSPDNRWIATAFQNIGGEAAVALLDTQADAHWWVNERAYQAANRETLFQQWLPNGDIIWLEKTTHFFVGNEQNHQAWETPAPMREVKYAANNVAFTQDEVGNLWRVDVASGQWEELILAGENVSGYYNIARDGSYAFALQDQEMWRIPAEMGTAVEPLPNVKMILDILGSGHTFPPPRQLGNTAFWLISLPFVLKGDVLSEDSIFSGIIVNTQDGTVLTAEEIGLLQGHYLTNLHLSPDGEWQSISLTDGESRQIVGLYLTPADDLTSGQLINRSELSVVGWHTNPPAVIFRNEASGTLSVAPLPLTDESPGIPLEGAGEWLTVLPGSIITTAADNPSRILQFDLEGNLLNTLDLSSQYKSVHVAQGATERVYLAAVGHQSQENNACTYGLIEWTPGSGS